MGVNTQFLQLCGMLPKGFPSPSPHSEYWIVSYGTGGGWGGRRLGELLGGIKGTQIQSVSQIPSRSPPLTTGNASLPSGIPKALCLTHTFSLPYGSRCTHQWAGYEQMETVSQICGPERDHKFEPQRQLWKNKRDAVSTRPEMLRLQRRQMSLRILPQREPEA